MIGARARRGRRLHAGLGPGDRRGVRPPARGGGGLGALADARAGAAGRAAPRARCTISAASPMRCTSCATTRPVATALAPRVAQLRARRWPARPRGDRRRSRPRHLGAAALHLPRRRRAGAAAGVPARLVAAAAVSSSGRALAPLRDEGVLVIGSGSITHNLRLVFSRRAHDRTAADDEPEMPESAAFRRWFVERSAATRPRRAVRLPPQAPHAALMHPTDEHLLPWYVAAGAGHEGPALRMHDSVTVGCLGMDAYAFGANAPKLAQPARSASRGTAPAVDGARASRAASASRPAPARARSAVVAQHLRHAQPVVGKVLLAPGALRAAVRLELAPAPHRLLVAPERQRQDLARLRQALEALDGDEAVDRFQLRRAGRRRA